MGESWSQVAEFSGHPKYLGKELGLQYWKQTVEAGSGERVEEVRVRVWTRECGEKGEPRMAWRLASG